MTTLAAVAAACNLAVEELEIWVERRWVLPVEAGSGLAFSDADLARVRMIATFRGDLGIDDDAMPVILRLLDQLHATRRLAQSLATAVADLPEEHRARILRRVLE